MPFSLHHSMAICRSSTCLNRFQASHKSYSVSRCLNRRKAPAPRIPPWKSDSVRPKHLSDQTSTMITTSNSLFRERDAQSSGRRATSRHVRLRAFPRSNRIQPTANIANGRHIQYNRTPSFLAPATLGAGNGNSSDVVSPGSDRLAPK